MQNLIYKGFTCNYIYVSIYQQWLFWVIVHKNEDIIYIIPRVYNFCNVPSPDTVIISLQQFIYINFNGFKCYEQGCQWDFWKCPDRPTENTNKSPDRIKPAFIVDYYHFKHYLCYHT